MKKIMVVLVLACVSIVVSAQDFRLGLGVGYSPESVQLKASGGGTTGTLTVNSSFLSFNAFLDAKYILVSAGYAFWINGQIKDSNFSQAGTVTTDTDLEWTYIPISVLLKYPFELNGGSSIFPLLGAEYDINLTWADHPSGITKDDASDDGKAALNHFYIKGGLGADIVIGTNVYLRPEALLAYKIPSKIDNDNVDYFKSFPGVSARITTLKADLGLSLVFKL